MSRFSHLMLTVTLLSMCLATAAWADSTDSGSGLQQGDPIGAFYVTKIAGAVDDSVEVGESLCYRCRYGSRPMVIVFARDTGGDVPALLAALDKTVAQHEEAGLKGLLTLIGEDAGVLKDEAEKVAVKTAAKSIPVVVAKKTQTGPESYKIAPDAEVTVILAKDSQVVSNHSFEADEIDVVRIIQAATTMLDD